jgi:glycosyltransferase involved in cell wall biosynthesis
MSKGQQLNLSSSFHVLMVSNVFFPIVGGISTYIDDLASAIKNEGGMVQIVAFPPLLSRAPRYLRWFFYLGFILHTLFLALLLRVRGKIPVVHSHSASFCLAAAAMCRLLLGCRSLHTFHSPLERPSLALNFWVPKVDSIVYVAEATRQLYRRHGVPEHERESLVPGGVDVSRYHPPAHRASQDDGLIRILFVGRICQEKGVREAIMAVQAVQCRVRLSIVGVAQNDTQKAYENELRVMVANDPGLSERVCFCGGLRGRALIEAFQSADFFIVPSLWDEPAPMVIAESFASGVPVIAFDSGGLKERVRDGEDGLIVPKGDIPGLATAFDRLSSDENLRRSLGEAARKRAEKDFSLETMLGRYRKIYAN